MDLSNGMMVAYTAILVMAVVPIYFGAFRSLAPQNPGSVDAMTTKDAAMFPVIGSAVLFGLYLLFKYLSKEWLNYLLSFYFLIVGVSGLTEALRPIVRSFFPLISSKTLVDFKFKIPFVSEVVDVKLTGAEIIGGVISVFVGVWYMRTKHWIANNIFGEAFSIVAIELIALSSFKVGCILLGGLFFYDIFWVFGTEVMVTVAKSFDAPVKLLWPRDVWALLFTELTEKPSFSMLGLGDIVIPGIFVALMLRFDQHRSKGSRTYFNACMFGYVLGLASTIFVMHTFQAAQPALLYLVPCCIGSVTITALVRGEFGLLWSYEEGKKTAAAIKKDE